MSITNLFVSLEIVMFMKLILRSISFYTVHFILGVRLLNRSKRASILVLFSLYTTKTTPPKQP